MPEQMSGQPDGDSQPSGNSQQNGNNVPPQASSPQTMAPDELAEILLSGAKNFKNQNGPANPPGNSPRTPMMNYAQLPTPQRLIAELAMSQTDRAVYSETQ